MRFATAARLGPFEILNPLGVGGMGEVYRARDMRLDRTVAIKLLPSHLVNGPGRRVERLRQEARAIARITHPNICTLFDVGEDGSAIFLVMEYVEGTTVAEQLQHGPIPLPRALRVAIGIADALDHAHRNNVVHRDLKPANIMLTRDSVKLLDFGLAMLTQDDEQVLIDPTESLRLTDVGTIMGTVPYMAPEQIEGRQVDARTDIFAFGSVVYEMVCGRRPFAGDSRAALMAAIVGAEPPPLSSLQPQIPATLERLVGRCLAKDPDDRWQTARDLAAELRWIAEPGSGATRATQVTTRRLNRPALWGGAVGAALTVAVLAGTLPLIWPRHAVPDYRPVTYHRGVVSSARFTSDGESFVYSASWDGQPYDAFLGRSGSGDARDLQLKDARVVSISRAGDMAVLFGPQNVARSFGAPTLARIPVAGGARRDLLTGVVEADWITGGDALAVIRDPGGGRGWTVEFPVGTTVHEAPAAWSLRVSPDGNRIAFFEGPRVFDAAPEAMITVIEKSGRKSTLARGLSGLGLAWAPSGQEIWFTATRPGQHAPQLHAVTLAGVERTVHRTPDWLVLHDISTEGKVLLSRNTIRISIACGHAEDARERDLSWQIGSLVTGLSRDGKSIVFVDPLGARAPSGKPTLFLRSIDGSPAVAIGEGHSGAFSPDGKWVLAMSGADLVLFPTGAGEAVTLPKGDVAQVGGASWLSDSKRIVFTGTAGPNIRRGYLQEIPRGLPRPITPDGVVLSAKAGVRDDDSVLGRVGPTWALFPIAGGDARPLPSLAPRDIPLQWSNDGRYVYTVDNVPEPRPAQVDVYRVELASGSRVLWKTLTPPDPVGVEDLRTSVTIAGDGQTYCYSYMRRLGDLFVVDGLK